jgi:spermidine synthase
MGFSFTVTQGLLIRELLVAFFGNELSIGLILGSWLVLEAVGSGLLGKLADRWPGSSVSFAALQLLFALFLPLCLVAAYTSRSLVGAIPGEGVGLVPIFYASFLILTPLALVDGAMFAFGCRAYATLTGKQAPAVGWVYVYEALGAIAGGVVFTYLLIPCLYSVQIVLLLSALNLLSAALLLASSDASQRKRPPLRLGLAAVLAFLAASLGLLLSPLTVEIQRWAMGQQWAGHNLVYSENSVYGNVAVVQREAQYTFYADGIPVLTAPVPDLALSEEIVHLPLLFVPQPRRALVLSGGAGGVLHELAKYPLERIDYAELDPLLIEAVLQFPTPLTRGELYDPRVSVELVDGRLLVGQKMQALAASPEQEGEKYDLVVVNLPYPSTLQLNRFYTAEFFEMVHGLLAQDGILVLGCPGTLTYMSDELRALNLVTYRTLGQAFPYVWPIPGDLALWLASPSDALTTVPLEALVDRWEGRRLETRLLTASHIRLRLDQRYLDWFWASLGKEEDGRRAIFSRLAGGGVNRDLHPVGLFHGLSYWNALFSPGLARFFAFAGRLNLWALSLPLVGCGLLLLALVGLTAKGKGAVVPLVVAVTGFSGMTADLVVIFAFQTLYGHVYHWIGLLITAFMAGLSLGGLLMTRRLVGMGGERSALLKLELALVVYWALLPVALSALYTRVTYPLPSATTQGILLFLNALAGFLVGCQFPLANRMWLKEGKTVGGAAGLIYACDLVGAFLASVVVSVVLIPVLGIVETCLLVAVLKLISLLLVATSRLRKSSETSEV